MTRLQHLNVFLQLHKISLYFLASTVAYDKHVEQHSKPHLCPAEEGSKAGEADERGVGIEHIDDIIADIAQALDSAATTAAPA